MSVTITNVQAVVSLIFGVLILINPKLLSTLVGIYLIIVGLVGLGLVNF